MMFLFGLGNPGKKYQLTRHNAGHLLTDLLGQVQGFCLLKSSAFMNNSGREVKRVLDETHFGYDNLVVIHDDVDLELGNFRLQKNRGSAGHGGVESIIKELGTQRFWRLRIGVGRPPAGVETEAYVLENFTQGEMHTLRDLAPKIKEKLEKMRLES